MEAEDYYHKFKDTFSRILPRYLDGKTQVAMSLTGGLDGRMIMAWADPPGGNLPCYTFNGQYRDCVDVKIARRIARLCGQSHQTIAVDRPFFSEFGDLAEKTVYISDGTMDVTGAVELYVNRIAAQIAPVRLTGNYGSEIVRGNVAFKPGRIDETLLDRGFAGLVREASALYGRERRRHDLSFIAFGQVPWHHYGRLSVELSQLTMRSPFLDNELVSLIYQAPSNLVSSKAPSLRLIAEGNNSLGKIPTDRGLLYRPVPFLTKFEHAYQEFTFRAEYAYDYGMPQWLARIDHRLAPLHPERMFLGRHKFYHFRVWYRDELSEFVRAVLLDPRSLARPYLEGCRVEEAVAAHIAGTANYTSEIHRLLTAELVWRRLVEEPGT
jgi:asparagine synthase (glutamine-hydrolysing)